MKLLLSILLLTLSAAAQIVVPPTSAECATSTDGSVVSLLNPLQGPQVTAVFSGTLPAATYYIEFSWYDSLSHVTLVSPEVQKQLLATGSLIVQPPASGLPAGASGMQVFIGTTSGGETLQGISISLGSFTQSTPLQPGQPSPPSSNNTICQIVANDAGWPTGTGYDVTLTTPAGNTYPGYPQQWQLLGPGNTINLSQGAPQYNGIVTFPSPIVASPYGHATQSIAGPLSLGGYPLTAGSLNITSGFNFTNAGVFNDTAVNQYVSSNIGGMNFLADFQAMQGNHGMTSALLGGISIPSGATGIISAGVSGFANTNVAGGAGLPNALGVYGQARCLVNSSDCFGANFAVKDVSGLTTGVRLNGIEVDLDPQNAPSAYAGMVGNTVILGPLASNDYANFRGYDVANGNGGGTLGVGYGTENAVADNAFQAGATCTTGSCVSQPYVAIGLNGGANAAASWKADATGDFVIVPHVGAAAIISAPVISTGSVPTLTGTGACATTSTQLGAGLAGSFHCTGTTGASTVTITPGIAAPNGWSCFANDLTTANTLRQSAFTGTGCTISGTVNANDVITFGAIAF